MESFAFAVIAAALVGYALTGNFTRYVADDFGTVLALRQRGFWAEQVANYHSWGGRISSTLVITAAALLGDGFARVLPGILIALWVGLVALPLRQLVPTASRLGRLLLAAGIVFATIRATPNQFFSLYWMTGSLTYVMPLLLAAVVVWMVSRPGGSARHRVLAVATTGLIAFVAGNANETYAPAQIVAVTLAIWFAFSSNSAAWRRTLPLLVAAWLGSLTALGVLLGSPGNAIRHAALGQLFAHRPSLLQLPAFTVLQTMLFFYNLFSAQWPTLLAVAILAAFIAARSGVVAKMVLRPAVTFVEFITLGTILVVTSGIAPAALEEGGLPPIWAQIVLVHTCVCSAATLGWVGGRGFRAAADLRRQGVKPNARLRTAIATAGSLFAGAAIVAGPAASVAAMVADRAAMQNYADAKDRQAALAIAAHAAGLTSAAVPPTPVDHIGVLNHSDYDEITSDSNNWVNQDVAGYYGIVDITTAVPSAR